MLSSDVVLRSSGGLEEELPAAAALASRLDGESGAFRRGESGEAWPRRRDASDRLGRNDLGSDFGNDGSRCEGNACCSFFKASWPADRDRWRVGSKAAWRIPRASLNGFPSL